MLEQTNARALTAQQIDRACDWVVCDASFIGLAKVLEIPLILAEPRCTLVALIKPQFEVRREEVGKGGIVRDPGAPRAGLRRGARMARGGRLAHRRDSTESPITGTEGNVEFLGLGRARIILAELARYRSTSFCPPISRRFGREPS